RPAGARGECGAGGRPARSRGGVARPGVDAELERGGRGERSHLAGLEPLLDAKAAILREAPVVGADALFAEAFAQVVGDALGHAPRVDEDERRPVLLDERGEAIVDFAPLLVG